MTQGKVALVTGVSCGIGHATAATLADQGFRVFGTTRQSVDAGAALGSVTLVRLDVRDDESVHTCVRAVLDQAGRLDALVNSAGYVLLGSLEETSIEEARGLFETNFFGVLSMCRAVLPVMRQQGAGRIVNVSSVLGFLPAPYMGIYAASKHAIEGYSESLDHELRQFGIRVSVIEPGFTRTSLGRNGQVTNQHLEPYAIERDRAAGAVREHIANGDDPAVVASRVLAALTSDSPRLKYPAGREARVLTLMRKFAPSGLVDKGLRKQFRLDAV